MKRFIDVHIPVTHCNLQCHYCYVAHEGSRNQKSTPFQFSAEHIGNALSQERLGGVCHFNLCGLGETLIPHETVEITYELLKHGHYVMIVTNGTLTNRIKEFCNFPLEYKKRLGFKFSFHYLEFLKKNLLDTFVKNIEIVKGNGMSFSVELTPSDELEPYIDEIKEFCLNHWGAYCHVTIPRDMTKRNIVLLSKHSFEEFCNIWSTFNSPMFDFKSRVWGERRREFCYAGVWSGLLNVGNGILNACYESGIQQDIFSNIDSPIDFVAVGCHCGLPHCYNSHSLLGLGDIPSIQGCTYAEERDRIDARDGSHWLNADMREFLSHKLYDYNEEFDDKEKKMNEEKRRKFIISHILKALKKRLRLK